jgi:hypothetical protein
MEPFSHQRAQLATGEGPSSPCLKAGAFWPQKGKADEPVEKPMGRSPLISTATT